MLRDENLELVYRELGRIRRQRYDLPNPEETVKPAPDAGRGECGDNEE